MKICPRCGRNSKGGEICSLCSEEMNFAGKKFKEIAIKVCAYCPSYFSSNKWKEFIRLKDVVRDVAQKSLGKNVTITPILPEIKLNPGTKHDIELRVDVSTREQYFIPAKIEVTLCSKCSMMGTQYFEGVLQLRNPKDKVVAFLHEDIEKQRSKGVFITTEKSVRNGIDFYITSKSYLESIGRSLLNKFGGVLKINYKIHTKKDSKDIYRVNVLFEAPDFGVGDVVELDGKVITIVKAGKKFTGVNLETRKNVLFDCRKTEPTKLDVVGTTVSKTYPDVEVLHPETYQSVKVENPWNFSNKEKVNVCVLEGKVFLV